ncbi:hypothetical protein [Pseudomonas sp. NPDC089547]|uniref:hypothetical protein n=1 Tax=Pseudomonas sp. NPDC089547 TaxID=3390652 RepID=UPI003CFDD1C6
MKSILLLNVSNPVFRELTLASLASTSLPGVSTSATNLVLTDMKIVAAAKWIGFPGIIKPRLLVEVAIDRTFFIEPLSSSSRRILGMHTTWQAQRTIVTPQGVSNE